jgi:5-aminolevulinate synthase
MAIPYIQHFNAATARVKAEDRYRIFTPLTREPGSFPEAAWTRPDGQTRPVTIWCSNDYLGMGQHPVVLNAMQEALRSYGAGSGGTRNISGNTPLHTTLEEEIADLHGQQSAIVFNSGYLANATVLASLARLLPEPVFFSDAKNHASMIEGMRLSRAEKHIFRHNDAGHLDELLTGAPASASRIVVLESVYSMDGSIAPLAAILDVAEKHGAFLYLDEVHGVGLYGAQGAGIAEAAGVQKRLGLVQGTFGKAFGLIGGYVAGPRAVIDALRSVASGFIFTTSLPPVIAAGAFASIRHTRQHPELRAQHQMVVANTKAALLKAGLPLLPGPSHILPLHIGNARTAKTVSDRLLYDHGIYVQPINYPTVPKGEERFRLTPTPLHTQGHIDALASALSHVLHGADMKVAQ